MVFHNVPYNDSIQRKYETLKYYVTKAENVSSAQYLQ